ncbi:hypothetical protein CJF30_00005353 [Rutstroemia sp. NJR-2017a BBW]|nr:hypothetical protein CJF30_00005353 [Rutstroemia sp. NJR-2017a BBW]
MVRGGTLQS